MKKFFLLLLLLPTITGLSQAVKAQDVDPAVARNYLIGPGDEITLRVLGEKDFDSIVTVDENGNIELPYIDKPVLAMCKSERELKSEISKLLGKYLRNPQIGLAVSARRSRPPVNVTGEVHTQQQVMLTRKTRLWELITFSGGVTEDAGGTIQVFRTQAPLCADATEVAAWKADTQASGDIKAPSRIYNISDLQDGQGDANPVIYPGDIVIVQKAKPIYIVGEVRGGQGGLLLKEGGLPLTRAIAMVGGVNREAKKKEVKIYRVKPGSTDKEIIIANLDLINKNEQKDVMLEPYDIIEVNKTTPGILSTILKTVGGAATGGATSIITGGATRILY